MSAPFKGISPPPRKAQKPFGEASTLGELYGVSENVAEVIRLFMGSASARKLGVETAELVEGYRLASFISLEATLRTIKEVLKRADDEIFTAQCWSEAKLRSEIYEALRDLERSKS